MGLPGAPDAVPRPGDDYSTVDGVMARFTELEQEFRSARDSRAIFVGAYIVITSAMKRAIDLGKFKDCRWVSRYLVNFAGLYGNALGAYEAGDMERVPAAWRVAFGLGERGEGTVLQHLLLGVNAHINHDLGVALYDTGIDPDRPVRYNDHTAVNAVLLQAAGDLQSHVERFYSPALYLVDEICGHWDEAFACLMVDKARELAWHHCVDLAGCACEEDRTVVLRRIDDYAGALAEIIARPYTTPFELFEAMRDSF